MTKSTVTSDWLWKNRAMPELCILYTRMADIVSGDLESSEGRIILNAALFDFESDFVDLDSELPHTMPSQKEFNRAAQGLGIHHNSVIVIYDSQGLYSSPRAWWMFKAMGHENVFVLDGGLPSWIANGYPVSDKPAMPQLKGDFAAIPVENAFVTAWQIQSVLGLQPDHVIIDARGAARFQGTAPEPRSGLRSGHIPSSANLPYQNVLDGGYLLGSNIIEAKLADSGATLNSHLYFSCGSGVTACIIALAAYSAGYPNLHVYDGSWTEWGGNPTLPIEL